MKWQLAPDGAWDLMCPLGVLVGWVRDDLSWFAATPSGPATGHAWFAVTPSGPATGHAADLEAAKVAVDAAYWTGLAEGLGGR